MRIVQLEKENEIIHLSIAVKFFAIIMLKVFIFQIACFLVINKMYT